MRSEKTFRLGFGALGILAFVLCFGFVTQQSWAKALWPAATGPISYTFIGSVIAAFGAAALWIAWKMETGSVSAIAITPAIALLGGSITLFKADQQTQWLFLAVFLVLGFAAAFVWGFSTGLSTKNRGLLPPLVKVSFAVFVVALLLAGGFLTFFFNVVPWPVDKVTGPMIGWIFIGDAAFFLYGLARPSWANGTPQLLAFLAYDIIIFPSLWGRIQTVPPEMTLNLTIYLIVVIYSGLLAIWYLLLNPSTALWSKNN